MHAHTYTHMCALTYIHALTFYIHTHITTYTQMLHAIIYMSTYMHLYLDISILVAEPAIYSKVRFSPKLQIIVIATFWKPINKFAYDQARFLFLD